MNSTIETQGPKIAGGFALMMLGLVLWNITIPGALAAFVLAGGLGYAARIQGSKLAPIRTAYVPQEEPSAPAEHQAQRAETQTDPAEREKRRELYRAVARTGYDLNQPVVDADPPITIRDIVNVMVDIADVRGEPISELAAGMPAMLEGLWGAAEEACKKSDNALFIQHFIATRVILILTPVPDVQ